MAKLKIRNRFQGLSESIPVNGKNISVVIPYGISDIDEEIAKSPYFQKKFVDRGLVTILDTKPVNTNLPEVKPHKKSSNN